MERGSGRGRGRGRGSRARGTKRGRKPKVVVLEEESNEVVEATKVEVKDLEPLPIAAVTPTLEEIEMQIDVKEIDMKADISKLEAPTFTTIQRNIPQLMLRLNWDHKVNLIGEKVLNPMIHCCDQCEKPILIYGRMIPCKHVFCLKCARTEILKTCPRCKDKVIRVEQTGLGTVFMCTHGGGRYESTGCRRTYLSQRDLQAHINHRHVSLPAVVESKSEKLQQQSSSLQANSHPRKDSLTSSSLPQATHSVKHDNQQQHLVGGNMQSQMNNMMSSHPPHTGANNKLTHDMHAFRNLNYGSSGQFNNSNQQQQNQPLSGSYPPYSSQSFNNMGHYSQQQQPPSTQQHQNWNQNQNQQYFR